MPSDPGDRVLFSADRIERRVAELGRGISRDYRGRDLVLVGVLHGALVFLADLMRHLEVPAGVDVICVETYGAGRVPGACRIHYGGRADLAGRDVLVVEDIVDTGLTLRYILDALRRRAPKTLEICALLHKEKDEASDIDVRYIGFPAPAAFVVGYGMDDRGRYRGLPWIGAIGDADGSGHGTTVRRGADEAPSRNPKDSET